MKRWVMRALAGLTAPAFCLLMSPKVWAAGRSTAAETPKEPGVSLSTSAGAAETDALSSVINLLPSSPNRAPSRDLLERSERLWGTRVDRGIVKDTLFLYTVEVDGETVLERVGSGCIEENYYVRVSDLSDISVSGRCRQAPNWKEMEEGDFEEPVGEGGNLRLRGYLHKEGAELYTCREITVTDKNGAVVYYDLDQQEATRDEHYSFLVTTSGGTHTAEAPEPVPDSEQEPVSEPEPAAAAEPVPVPAAEPVPVTAPDPVPAPVPAAEEIPAPAAAAPAAVPEPAPAAPLGEESAFDKWFKDAYKEDIEKPAGAGTDQT